MPSKSLVIGYMTRRKECDLIMSFLLNKIKAGFKALLRYLFFMRPLMCMLINTNMESLLRIFVCKEVTIDYSAFTFFVSS